MVDEVVDHVRESCKHSNQRNCIFARSTAILGIPVGQFKGLQPGNSLVGTLYAINIFFSLNPGSKGTSNHYQKGFSNKGRVTMIKD